MVVASRFHAAVAVGLCVCLSPCELRLCPVECVPGSSRSVFATQQALQARPGIAIRDRKAHMQFS